MNSVIDVNDPFHVKIRACDQFVDVVFEREMLRFSTYKVKKEEGPMDLHAYRLDGILSGDRKNEVEVNCKVDARKLDAREACLIQLTYNIGFRVDLKLTESRLDIHVHRSNGRLLYSCITETK